ncbi:AIR synthase related protein [Bacillota bacterium LX-D]|nr:AIR synthase related protein [Bacillota bacterium LX-D]
MIRRIRDLTLIEIEKTLLVIACDSAGAIGTKPLDKLQLSGQILGKMITAVPLMEVLASGAKPITVINTLSVEAHPAGVPIIEGVREAVAEAGLDIAMINGSTEDNMPTLQTGIGVTVIGTTNSRDLRLGTSEAGDLIYVVGTPMVGEEVLKNQQKAAGIKAVLQLLQQEGIHEILPVGSKGISYELHELAKLPQCHVKFLLNSNSTLDIHKTAGPATCLLVSVKAGYEDALECLNVPFQKIAQLVQ